MFPGCCHLNEILHFSCSASMLHGLEISVDVQSRPVLEALLTSWERRAFINEAVNVEKKIYNGLPLEQMACLC